MTLLKTSDALVIVHPGSALRGPSTKLSMQWTLAGEWRGPAFIIEDDAPRDGIMPAAASYQAVLDEVAEEREAKGVQCRYPGGDEAGLLENACDEISKTIAPGAHITVTGAWADGCVAAAAQCFAQAGFEVSIDASAIWPDEVDEEADRQMQARLAALMKDIRPKGS